MAILTGNEAWSNMPKRTQVYQATHAETGTARLPFMYRSFISFTFGGKSIEDYNLLATISGDRLQRDGYAKFEDLTSKYEVLDGQLHWGTHYTDHEMDFDLATDGITEEQLQNFLQWFSAGRTRELILAEHPNRAIMARVAEPPALALLPFGEETIKKINGVSYKTKTTVYKGEITLRLVMDEPYWYAKINVFGHFDNGVYRSTWTDANGIERSIFDDPDAIKVALEDNIPIADMITTSMLLGGDTFANVGDDTGKIAYAPYYIKVNGVLRPSSTESGPPDENGDPPEIISVIAEYINNTWVGARITGAAMNENGVIETFAANSEYHLYYAGTAPSYPTIWFNIIPIISTTAPYYIVSPCNNYSKREGLTTKNYNTITIESLHQHKLQFTTPSVWTGYNQAQEIFYNMEVGEAWTNVRNQIRDYVNHQAPRAWANFLIDLEIQTSNVVNENSRNRVMERMCKFLNSKDTAGTIFAVDGIERLMYTTFMINCKTGNVKGVFHYRTPPVTHSTWAENITDTINYDLSTIYYFEDIGNTLQDVEQTGDMIRSDLLYLEDRNYPNDNGEILAYNGNSEIGKGYSHKISHDVVYGISNVKIKYDNMYL